MEAADRVRKMKLNLMHVNVMNIPTYTYDTPVTPQSKDRQITYRHIISENAQTMDWNGRVRSQNA